MPSKPELQAKLKYLAGLEKKVEHLLKKEENSKITPIIEEILDGYHQVGANNKVNYIKRKYWRFIEDIDGELGINMEGISNLETRDKILFYIEALEKKVKRRILQNRTTEAIEDLKFIISQLRRIKLNEKADLLESTLNQFILELEQETQRIVSAKTSGQYSDVEISLVVDEPVKTAPTAKPPKWHKPSSFRSQPKPPDLVVQLTETATIPPPNNASSTEETITPPDKQKPLTLKDQPLSEEELLISKLFEIKDLLEDKKRK